MTFTTEEITGALSNDLDGFLFFNKLSPYSFVKISCNLSNLKSPGSIGKSLHFLEGLFYHIKNTAAPRKKEIDTSHLIEVRRCVR